MRALVFALCALPFVACATDAERLASEPNVTIENHVCHIQGAFWDEAQGAVPFKDMALVDSKGAVVMRVKTNAEGVYNAEVPMPEGHGLRLREAYSLGPVLGTRTTQWRLGVQVPCFKPTVTVGEVQQQQ